MTLREHKVIEYAPGMSDLLPCLTATGDLTEVNNGQAHIRADAGCRYASRCRDGVFTRTVRKRRA